MKYLGVTMAVMLAALLLFGCGDDGRDKNPVDPATTDTAEFIQSIDDLPEPITYPEQVEFIGAEIDTVNGDELWACNSERHDIAIGPSEFPVFTPNAEIIWPGIALQGGTVASPTPGRIIARRGPGDVIINNITGSAVSSVHVDEVSFSNIAPACNAIIASQPESFPANVQVTVSRLRTEDDLMIALSANASFLSLLKSSFNFTWQSQSSYKAFLVKIEQSFYTLTFQRPNSIYDFFAPEVTADDLRGFAGPGNPPVYMSSVNYGRRFYLLVQATEEADSMYTSLSASFVFGGGSGSAKYITQFANLQIDGYAWGGDAANSLGAMLNAINSGQGTLDDWRQSLNDAATITTGLPLSYVVRSVATDMIVKNGIATQYETRDCDFVGHVEAAPDLQYYATISALETSDYNHVYTWYDAERRGQPMHGESDGVLRGRRSPFFTERAGDFDYVRFSSIGFSPGIGCLACGYAYLDFDAANMLIGGDYTILCALEYSSEYRAEPTPDLEYNLLSGTSTSPGRAVSITLTPGHYLRMTHHDGQGAAGSVPVAARDGFAVYAFEFSRDSGIRIGINGATVALAPNATSALTSFVGPKLGFTSEYPSTNMSYRMPELLIFGQKLPADILSRYEEYLSRKYCQ